MRISNSVGGRVRPEKRRGDRLIVAAIVAAVSFAGGVTNPRPAQASATLQSVGVGTSGGMNSAVALADPIPVPQALDETATTAANTLPAIDEPVEYSKLIRSRSAVGALGSGLLGESIDYYTGQTDFVATDVSLPGLSLPVAVGRRYHVTNRQGGVPAGAFGDWDLDLPHVEGVVATGVGWTAQALQTDARCNYFGAPPPATVTSNVGGSNVTTTVPAAEYSTGFTAVIPGLGRHELLLRASGAPTPGGTPPAGGTYPVITKDLWAVSCKARPESPPGQPDEGFVVTTPDGVTYTFLQGWVRPHAPLTRPADSTTAATVSVDRQEMWLLPTTIEDRFGNKVTYTYASDTLAGIKLQSVQSTDGRTLTLSYANGRIDTITDGNSHTWAYHYNLAGHLDTVTLPDTTTWAINLEALNAAKWTYTGASCTNLPSPSSTATVSGTIRHPSGALGTFTFKPTRHGRSGAPGGCITNSANVGFAAKEPAVYDVLSLTNKKIEGPRIPSPLTWAVEYAGCSSNSCSTTKTTKVTDPRSYSTLYTFSAQYTDTGTGAEGQLIELQSGGSGGSYLSDERYSYYSASGQLYPSVLGTPAQVRGDVAELSSLRPVQSRTLTVSGQTYKQTLATPDAYGFSTSITRKGSVTRTDTLTYAHNTADWVLGTVKKVVNDGKTSMELTLDDHSEPTAIRSFGLLRESRTYYDDGTLHTIVDSAGHTTSYSNYKFGIPQNVTYANGEHESVDVTKPGQIASAKDAYDHVTYYNYDSMGRVTSITPPAPYNTTPTNISYSKSNTTGWARTTTTGSATVTDNYDAFFRPVQTTDSLNRDVTRTYDVDGRLTFQSYPGASGSGTSSSYDALGRLSSVSDAESHTTTYTYGSDQLTITSPNNHDTVYQFMSWDEPTQAFPASITTPTATTTVSRDTLGKPTTIKRGLITRTYNYTTNERLQSIDEPETGTTSFNYDTAGNIYTVTHDGQATETRTYDTRNRLTGISYSDGSPSVALTWRADNQPDTATRGAIKRTYSYDGARLLSGESVSVDSAVYTLGYDRDANGHLSTLRYPDGTQVALSPDAFGRPSKVGAYATAVSYFKDGAIQSFIYGNGISHSLTQTTRHLPNTVIDAGVINSTYGYDANGNPTSITDSVSSRLSRTLTYDANDRLLTATGPWGSTTLSYDAQDNLTGDTAPGNAVAIDGTNRASSLTAGGTTALLTWDSRGRLKTRTLGAATTTYSFDAADLLQSITQGGSTSTYTYDSLGYRAKISASGTSTVSIYDSAGRLMYDVVRQDAIADRLFRDTFEPQSSSITTKYLYLGSHLVARERNDGATTATTYVHADGVGSPVATTDANRNVVGTTTYLPYGGLFASTGTGNQSGPNYAGQYADSTGLVYMHARYYDPAMHRFISADPVAASDASAANFNRYSYAANSPYAHYDPSGRCDQGLPDHNPDVPLPPDSPKNDDGFGACDPPPSPTIGETAGGVLDGVNATLLSMGPMGVEVGGVEAGVTSLARAVFGGGEEAAAIIPAAQRAKEIADSMGKTKNFVTIAVVETEEGVRIVASSENALRPAARAALADGEVAVTGLGHAEVTGVSAARSMGLTPTGAAASRPICSICAEFLRTENVAPLSPLKQCLQGAAC